MGERKTSQGLRWFSALPKLNAIDRKSLAPPIVFVQLFFSFSLHCTFTKTICTVYLHSLGTCLVQTPIANWSHVFLSGMFVYVGKVWWSGSLPRLAAPQVFGFGCSIHGCNFSGLCSCWRWVRAGCITGAIFIFHYHGLWRRK